MQHNLCTVSTDYFPGKKSLLASLERVEVKENNYPLFSSHVVDLLTSDCFVASFVYSGPLDEITIDKIDALAIIQVNVPYAMGFAHDYHDFKERTWLQLLWSRLPGCGQLVLTAVFQNERVVNEDIYIGCEFELVPYYIKMGRRANCFKRFGIDRSADVLDYIFDDYYAICLLRGTSAPEDVNVDIEGICSVLFDTEIVLLSTLCGEKSIKNMYVGDFSAFDSNLLLMSKAMFMIDPEEEFWNGYRLGVMHALCTAY